MSQLPTENPIRVVDYYDRFACLGGDCPQTCCQGWNILLDDKACHAFAESDRNAGTTLVADLIVTDGDLTRMKLDEKGYCPSLMSDGLCGLYDVIGPEQLPRVCDVYPRFVNVYDCRRADIYTALSCPVSVDLAVFREAPLGWVGNRHENPERLKGANLDLGDEERFVDIAKAQDLFLAVLQHRSVSLNRRLMAILMICYRYRSESGLSPGLDLKALCNDLSGLLAGGLDDIPELPANPVNQFTIFIELARRFIVAYRQGRHASSDLSRKVLRMFDEALAGYGIIDFSKINQSHANAFVLAQQSHVTDYLTKQPWVLENIFAHQFMTGRFPFDRDVSIAQQFLSPVLNSLLICGVAGGLANYYGELTDDRLKEVIFLLSRVLLHGEVVRDVLLTTCSEMNVLEMGQIYTLFAR